VSLFQDEDMEEDPPEEEDEEPLEETEIVKQASRGGTYALCSRAKLDGLASKFGLTPEEFAENLRDNYQRHEVQQEPNDPDVTAQEYYSR
jgi:transcription elongation factor SPT6